MQDELQTLYTSGTVFHAFLGEKLPDWKAAASLVRKIAENYKLPYYTMSPTYSVCRNHGYLAGEVYTCPHCGEKTEVYSRITGYYRPVQNWNDGKAQEFRDRRVYDIGASHLTHRGPQHPDAETEKAVPAESAAAEKAAPAEPASAKQEKKPLTRALLFTSSTCPNCKLAKALLQKEGFLYKEVLASENLELANRYGVKQAPTLIVIQGEKTEKFKGVSEIKGMLTAWCLENQQKAM